MDTAFWHERWAKREIGFHRSQVHPMLVQHWPYVADGTRSPVLVPLCGKSLDLKWLADRGHPVVGVELSERAVSEFFEEHHLDPAPTRVGGLDAWTSGSITLAVGDFFEFAPEAPFPLIFDRAAMVALPRDRRDAYRRRLTKLLAANGRGLLITLEYLQASTQGPPFSVERPELASDPQLCYRSLEQLDALAEHPVFEQRGISDLTERASLFRHSRTSG